VFFGQVEVMRSASSLGCQQAKFSAVRHGFDASGQACSSPDKVALRDCFLRRSEPMLV
jgi:hypothetical protein